MVLLSGLLAASLIDAELFIIPIEIPWIIVPLAVISHAVLNGRFRRNRRSSARRRRHWRLALHWPHRQHHTSVMGKMKRSFAEGRRC